MKVGVISDIHGNRVALREVLAEMPDVDHLVCAGDVVGYNPWHADCVDAVRGEPAALPEGPWPTVPIPTVMGNHDRAVAGETPFTFNGMAQAGVEHAREQLDDEQLSWLADLTPERHLFDDRVKMVHGHPEDPDHYTYPDEFGPELLEEEELLIMGHTHHQHHEVYDEGIVCNPGSVGQPRDGNYRAAFAVVDLDERTVHEHRVAYDTTVVIDAVEEAGLPREIGFRLTQGR
ncbi:metallophosphoesterase family protein [Haloarcula salinisoli]|uniref:Metallophosphatase family protein n=1 Tax=Haloarcula salinisoli TaxID=2487746 RepID=A0A8J8CCW6_9EURY|nr:metallophosphoesterase family protein [Halomicroarcula salinisoli]MBX0286705.1 metallophosphatase family protein [Halomicroarcula salinisoli]MBX0304015.1 metallophosphatase family protein [Halomicroarcula salinisoli]